MGTADFSAYYVLFNVSITLFFIGGIPRTDDVPFYHLQDVMTEEQKQRRLKEACQELSGYIAGLLF